MQIDVLDTKGKSTGRKIDLPADIFGIEPNEHSVYLAVKQYLAHQRQGTHKAKEKGEITASTRKIKKQKGTGTARAGSIKSGLFRGGGRIFGPRPRTYSIKLNKKVARLARKSAFSSKAAAGQIKVVEDFTLEGPKTKVFVDILKGLDLADTKTLMVTSTLERDVLLSSRNLKKASVQTADNLNTYELMNANIIVLSEGSIEKIKETFA